MNKKKNDKKNTRRPRRNPFVRVEGAALFRLDDGTRLDWVPGYEPHLLFATDIFDKEKDPMLRVYRVIRRNGRQYRCQLDNMLERFRGRDKLRCRLRYGTHINGKNIRLLRSQLTVLCLTGFPIADRRHWVIDHKAKILFSGGGMTSSVGIQLRATCVENSSALFGDINGDGSVDVSDLNILINVMLGIVDGEDYDGDLNGDGQVDVSDINLLVNSMLGSE